MSSDDSQDNLQTFNAELKARIERAADEFAFEAFGDDPVIFKLVKTAFANGYWQAVNDAADATLRRLEQE